MKLLQILTSVQLLLILLFRGGIELNPGPFPCKFCCAVPETISSSIHHQQLHAVTKTFFYHCPVPSCIFSTKSLNFINQHVSLFHPESSHVDPDASESLCCVCISGGIPCTYSSTSLRELVQHLCTHIESQVEVMCPIDGCDFKRNFKKTSTFRVHLSQYHPNWRAEGCPKERKKHDHEDVSIPKASDEGVQDEGEGPCFGDEETHELFSDSAVLDCIAKFYLQLYGLHSLPYETIQDVCNGLICISEIVHAKMKVVLTEELKKQNIAQNEINVICHKVSCADLLYTSHHKDKGMGPFLSSDHLRKKYFQENFDFTAPKEINLDEDDPESDKRQEIIPITATLLRLFEDGVVCKDIDKSFLKKADENNNLVSNYTDGQQFLSENHPSKEIHLFLYQDTVNGVMNALGSAKNKYKLLTMYFTLGNLKPHRRAKVNSKHLIMMMRETVFKSVGAEKSLKEVMDELKLLEREGMLYKGERIKVVVIFVQGDNLGQHLIGGFIECFSGDNFCRFCIIGRSEFKADPTLIMPARTLTEYNRCLLKALATGKPCNGIKACCEFNDLKYVHALTHLVPCLAHDVFEGVVNWDLAGIISHLVHEDKWFSYKWLNKRIKELKCLGADAPNKPAFVRTDGEKLGGHAVQNWSMLRLLPFILDKKIQDVENPAWKLYLHLKDVSEWLTAPSFSKPDLPYLHDVLLPAYFDQRAEVLDTEKYPLKPKHHLMRHSAQFILWYGPLIQLWTLPYEQRHKFFKHLLRLSQNFINPEHSCAFRYQIYVSYMASDGPIFPEECIEVGAKHMTHTAYTGELARVISDSFEEPGWRDCTSVCFEGLKYKKEDLLLLAEHEGNVIARVIKVMATKEDTLSFVCECHEGLREPSLGIYKLSDPSGKFIHISFSDLKYPVPHPLYYFKGNLSFSLKPKLLPKC